ncbi:MAG: MFS transporter [Chloroflexi bacterium]|nr:MFS transporter [Chloroflexota bacterium]
MAVPLPPGVASSQESFGTFGIASCASLKPSNLTRSRDIAEITRVEAGASTRVKARPRIFYGWWVVFGAAAMNLYSAGLWFYGFPIFFKALLDEFGWARSVGAAVVSFSRLEGGIEAPVLGWAVDKFGPRKLAIIGVTIFGFGLMTMSMVTDFSLGPIHVSALIAFIVLYAGVMSVGRNTGFGHAAIAAINAWFIKKRSRAFALFSLGAGGSGLTVFALGWIISNYGWRTAALVGGLGMFVVCIPLATLLRRRPEDYGYLPDGEDPSEQASRVEQGNVPAAAIAVASETDGASPRGTRSLKVQSPTYDFSLKEALLTAAFWMLVLGTSARAIAMTSIVVHEVAYLTDIGISLTQASAALGGMVFISLIGRAGFGWLGDYIEIRYLLIATFLLQALGIFILDRVNGMAMVWVFVVIYGIAYGGAIPLYFSVVGEYFGRKNYATIRGFMQFFQIPATFAGPIYAGLVFDLTGSYHFAFISFVFALLTGTVFVFLARHPKPPASAEWVRTYDGA